MKIAMSGLQAVVTDFMKQDHDWILSSGLVDILKLLLSRQASDGLMDASWSFYEIILTRCLTMESKIETSTLVHSLRESLSEQLTRVSNQYTNLQSLTSEANPASCFVDPKISSAGLRAQVVMPGMWAHHEQIGRAVPHKRLGREFSLTCWVYPTGGSSGVIWRKGGTASLSEEEMLKSPWACFGLTLNARREL